MPRSSCTDGKVKKRKTAKAKAARKPKGRAVEQVTAYKAFNPDMTCRGFKYEIGQTYKHDGAVSMCNSGFHACALPMDCFSYYPFGSPIAKVRLTGKIERREEDSKVAAAEITIEAHLEKDQLDGVTFEETADLLDRVRRYT